MKYLIQLNKKLRKNVLIVVSVILLLAFVLIFSSCVKNSSYMINDSLSNVDKSVDITTEENTNLEDETQKAENIIPKDYLIVVDMQKDFIDGAVSCPEAASICQKVINRTNNFDGEVWFTQDTHDENYLNTQEGQMQPIIHCVENSEGWMLLPELEKYKNTHNCKTFLKNTFGCKDMAEQALKDYQNGKIKSITLIGLCTDICIISNALLLKSFMPDLTIYVDSSCCAGTTPEMHQNALDTMLCCQIYAY